MKKFLSLLMSLIFIVSIPVSVNAVSLNDGSTALKNQFKFGEGPKVGGYSVDYRYYSPVKNGSKTKYPLVIWLHGNKNGSYDGQQVYDVINWSSSEFQGRFSSAKGAFILTPRCREENGFNWDAEEMFAPLKSAIDSFIEKNKANIDLNRIYIGGFSMGGMMTLKVLSEYPEMFAAAFPYCPGIYLTKSMAKKFKNVPVWLTSSNVDPTVDYDFLILTAWKNITATSKVKAECRFSTLGQVCYPDGSAAASNHYSWFAVRYDMFTTKGKAYPNMSTVDGNGKSVTLTYPNGMISWLSAHSSEYGGAQDDSGTDSDSILSFIRESFGKFIQAIKNAISSII